MTTLVMKFGGTSVGSAARIREVARIVQSRQGSKRVVVVSAMAGVTNSLFEMAEAARNHDLDRAVQLLSKIEQVHLEACRSLEIATPEVIGKIKEIVENLQRRVHGIDLLGELSPRTMDEIASAGERLSSILVASFMDCPLLDARKVIRTDSHFGGARPRLASIKKFAALNVVPLLESYDIIVTQGYIGSDDADDTTTLGRGGSDYSAGLLGAAIQADEIEIWTDVEGILTADPRIVPGARTVEILGYDEAAELASYGAKVLHPATVRPALDAGVPVSIRSTFRPNGMFSTISPGESSGRPCVAIAMRRNVVIISVTQESMTDQSGFLAKLFDVFGRRGISVDLVSTSEICVSVSLDKNAPLDALTQDLGKLGQVSIAQDRAVIAVVGDLLRKTPEVLRTTFVAIDGIPVDFISMGANAINLSLIVQEQDAERAMRNLHTAFFEGGSR
ncbi:MAG: aspartate kinase [Rectinema sp.]|jgi:aspartate kinase|nr:aspartate kinase [Spirochaetaceae bacterium]